MGLQIYDFFGKTMLSRKKNDYFYDTQLSGALQYVVMKGVTLVAGY